MRPLLAVILVSPRTLRAVFHQSLELDVRSGGGIDVSPGKQDFRRQADRFAEVAR